eukprot:1179730-Prorocentrum_minimum.AAC.4
MKQLTVLDLLGPVHLSVRAAAQAHGVEGATGVATLHGVGLLVTLGLNESNGNELDDGQGGHREGNLRQTDAVCKH